MARASSTASCRGEVGVASTAFLGRPGFHRRGPPADRPDEGLVRVEPHRRRPRALRPQDPGQHLRLLVAAEVERREPDRGASDAGTGHADAAADSHDLVDRAGAAASAGSGGEARYFEDLSEAETARILDCLVGTVKLLSKALVSSGSTPRSPTTPTTWPGRHDEDRRAPQHPGRPGRGGRGHRRDGPAAGGASPIRTARRRRMAAAGGTAAAVAAVALAVVPGLGSLAPDPGPADGPTALGGRLHQGRRDVPRGGARRAAAWCAIGGLGQGTVSFEFEVGEAGLRFSPTCHGPAGS